MIYIELYYYFFDELLRSNQVLFDRFEFHCDNLVGEGSECKKLVGMEKECYATVVEEENL